MTKHCFIFILSFVLSGCFLGIHTEHYTYCHRVDVEGNRLRLDGYYAYEWPKEDSILLNGIVLWSDGTAVSFLLGDEPPYDSTMIEGVFDKLHERLRERIADLSGERARWHPSWGAYRLIGDTISIQVMQYFRYELAYEYRALGYEGIVLNDSTFTIDRLLVLQRDHTAPRNETYRFFPLDEKPSSENWTHDLCR